MNFISKFRHKIIHTSDIIRLKNQESNGKIEENKNYNNSGNQKVYYKDYLSASDRSNFNDLNENFLGEQNNSKFLMYYNEIYRDNKK